MGGLETGDFARLAEQWGDDFLLVTHHFDGRTVGFHCGLHLAEPEGGTVEAYFVGFEPELNKECALYQRMLIEFIHWGIGKHAQPRGDGPDRHGNGELGGRCPSRCPRGCTSTLPLAMPVIRWMIRRSPPHPFKPRRAWRAEWLDRWDGRRVPVQLSRRSLDRAPAGESRPQAAEQGEQDQHTARRRHRPRRAHRGHIEGHLHLHVAALRDDHRAERVVDAQHLRRLIVDGDGPALRIVDLSLKTSSPSAGVWTW